MTNSEAEQYAMPLNVSAENRKMAHPPCSVKPIPYLLNQVGLHTWTGREHTENDADCGGFPEGRRRFQVVVK